jgi:hypothetical protein
MCCGTATVLCQCTVQLQQNVLRDHNIVLLVVLCQCTAGLQQYCVNVLQDCNSVLPDSNSTVPPPPAALLPASH